MIRVLRIENSWKCFFSRCARVSSVCVRAHGVYRGKLLRNNLYLYAIIWLQTCQRVNCGGSLSLFHTPPSSSPTFCLPTQFLSFFRSPLFFLLLSFTQCRLSCVSQNTRWHGKKIRTKKRSETQWKKRSTAKRAAKKRSKKSKGTLTLSFTLNSMHGRWQLSWIIWINLQFKLNNKRERKFTLQEPQHG